MILYRGTLKPENRPTPVEHHCAFFSTSWGYAMDYATQTGGRGYLQTYAAPDDLALLDIYDPRARELGQEYLGRELPKPDFKKILRDPLLELFRYPEKDWTEGLKTLGYQGTTTGDDICVFDTSGFSQISQERVGGKRS